MYNVRYTSIKGNEGMYGRSAFFEIARTLAVMCVIEGHGISRVEIVDDTNDTVVERFQL